MDKNNMISVLITFYNQEKYVDQCIQSVLMQKTSFDFKIIIGDDGSTDNTLEIIKLWKSRYPENIEYYTQEREISKSYNGGIRASQNRLSLLRKVNTKYFIFLDGDDYYTDENKLQIQYDLLEKDENGDCICCGHQVKIFNENDPDKIELIPNNLLEGKLDIKEYWKKHYIHSDSILFRSSYIKDLQYEKIDLAFNDNLITYSFMQYGKMFYVPKCMADYRQNSNGIWAGQSKDIGVIRNIISLDLEMNINPDLKAECLIRHFYDFRYFKKNKINRDLINSYSQLYKKHDLLVLNKLKSDGNVKIKYKFNEQVCYYIMFLYHSYLRCRNYLKK